LDCDTCGTRGIIPSQASMNPGQERDISLEPSRHVGQGEMEALWSRWGHMWTGGFHDGIPIFFLYINYVYGVKNTKDSVSLMGMGI